VKRDAFLAWVRAALGRHPGDAVPSPPEPPADALVHPSTRDLADRDALVERFVERAAAAGAEVRRARDATAARELAAAWARELGDTAVAGDDGMARAVVAASGLPTVGVAEADVGITGAYRAIAETGTVVLRSESGRLAGLLPPVHLALVAEAAVVGGSSDVYRDFSGAPPAALVQVTGPSRTADIEMTLITGVHGPGRLAVMVFGGE
jgi:L-lactate dehydrogenase complex protein LldG